MADAKPTKGMSVPSTLPPGKGNNLIKTDCPTCGRRYGYWEEEGNKGCPKCETEAGIKEIADNRKADAETAAQAKADEKATFDAAVKAEVAKQIAAAMGKTDEKPSKKSPFSKK
jgi:uncharacterized Zn finger protein (UPF0148 family)